MKYVCHFNSKIAHTKSMLYIFSLSIIAMKGEKGEGTTNNLLMAPQKKNARLIKTKQNKKGTMFPKIYYHFIERQTFFKNSRCETALGKFRCCCGKCSEGLQQDDACLGLPVSFPWGQQMPARSRHQTTSWREQARWH